MKINVKVVESWLRHAKSNSAAVLVLPALLEALKVIKPNDFQYGFNKDTAVILLAGLAIATVTVAYQVIVKKRPDLAPIAGKVEQIVVKQLESVATSAIAASPDPATHLQGVPAPN